MMTRTDFALRISHCLIMFFGKCVELKRWVLAVIRFANNWTSNWSAFDSLFVFVHFYYKFFRIYLAVNNKFARIAVNRSCENGFVCAAKESTVEIVDSEKTQPFQIVAINFWSHLLGVIDTIVVARHRNRRIHRHNRTETTLLKSSLRVSAAHVLNRVRATPVLTCAAECSR